MKVLLGTDQPERSYLEIARMTGVITCPDEELDCGGPEAWQQLISAGKIDDRTLMELSRLGRGIQTFANELRVQYFTRETLDQDILSLEFSERSPHTHANRISNQNSTPEYYRQGFLARWVERLLFGLGVYEAVLFLGAICLLSLVAAITYMMIHHFPSDHFLTEPKPSKVSNPTFESNDVSSQSNDEIAAANEILVSSAAADQPMVELDAIAQLFRVGHADQAAQRLGGLLKGERFDEYEMHLNLAVCGMMLECADSSSSTAIVDCLIKDGRIASDDWKWLLAVWLLKTDQPTRDSVLAKIEVSTIGKQFESSGLRSWFDAHSGNAEIALKQWVSNKPTHVLDKFYFCLATFLSGQSSKVPLMLDHLEQTLTEMPLVKNTTENLNPRLAIENRRFQHCRKELHNAIASIRNQLDVAQSSPQGAGPPKSE